MNSIHVRFSPGQTVLYNRFPDRICTIDYVYDSDTPVHYDISIPIFNGSEGLNGRCLHARGITPDMLRAVDEIPL